MIWQQEHLTEILHGVMRFPEGIRGKRNSPEDYIKENLEEIPDGVMKFPEDTKGKMNSLED